ncbi:Flp pilus assembly protein TadG [Bosea sp. BE125]|uniref:pilus assembly protein n=1 Tax=Bosea sp. BE125 TaxID=2817909 RepID=UPI00285E36C2|nr:pilus assembly protein [Bosea sp. BE125]MDR6869729.1 Flp pilus assembly protein TadG [Bosea sp. BE125]
MERIKVGATRFMSLCAGFARDRSGNVMMLFGLSMIPVLGLVGAAVDYSRATTMRTMLNAAIDSAALMAARDAAKLTDAQLRDRVNGWIRANLHGDAADGFSGATIAIDRTGRTINISATASLTTSLTQLISQNAVQISSSSQSSWGTNTIELALVLDNTGSMASSGKIDALKTASLDLLKIMKDATSETDQIKISIVPFSTRVILDTSNKDANWLRWDQSVTTCSNWWPYPCTTTTISKSTWQGCVADRDKSYDVQDGDGGGTNGSAYPADFCDAYSPSTQAKVMPLTSNWDALTQRINAMTPVGATNVTIGAAWGMATLSPGTPFAEAKPLTTPRLKKFMILLTDGDNTKNRFEGDGSTSNPNIDARTKLACANAQTAGIVVYTVRVMDGNRDLLKACASDAGKYFEVTAASQLSPIFKQIASEISAVRLTM